VRKKKTTLKGVALPTTLTTVDFILNSPSSLTVFLFSLQGHVFFNFSSEFLLFRVLQRVRVWPEIDGTDKVTGHVPKVTTQSTYKLLLMRSRFWDGGFLRFVVFFNLLQNFQRICTPAGR
jgi:hypothetical protein